MLDRDEFIYACSQKMFGFTVNLFKYTLFIYTGTVIKLFGPRLSEQLTRLCIEDRIGKVQKFADWR